ncbi:hypothetical protein IAG25_39010 [Caballeronia sp. EK]|uniref:hypothetical protein n=1 Tax=Caballeronia sp. EK TaxID=2767469 RepID=UPI001655639E|nr:hypothetical protein [Caballeronia sp. EK]MBC8642788.1 hypothetical protein [Caballeronia sp. EK]
MLLSVDFTTASSIQQARNSICSALEDALGDHLFERDAKQSALQQVATLALARQAQRQSYDEVQGLTSRDLRTAQIILVSRLSPVGVSAFLLQANPDCGHVGLEFRFHSGRDWIDPLMGLSFNESRLGDELKDLADVSDQFASSLIAAALNEALSLDPEGRDSEIQAAVGRLNSHTSAYVQSEQPSSRGIFSSKTELPVEMLLKIQSYMPRRDLDALRCVNREFSTLDADEVANANALMEVAANVKSQKEFETVIDDIEKLLPGHRQKPLTKLLARLLWLPRDQRVTQLDRVLAAAEQLNVADTSRLLTSIAHATYELPRPSRTDAFTRTLSAVKRLNMAHQVGPLIALSDRIDSLRKEKRSDVFTRVLTHVEQLDVPERGVVLARLFAKVGFLSEQYRSLYYQRIFDAIERLDTSDRGSALFAVARNVKRVRGSLRFPDNRPHTLYRFLSMLAPLSYPHRQQVGELLAYRFKGQVRPSDLSRAIKAVEARYGMIFSDKREQPSKKCSVQ